MTDGLKTTILLVEDNEVFANVLRFNLESAGYEVVVTGDGQGALQKAPGEQFDVVLTDEDLPNMAGQDFCRRLRNEDGYAETPIIFVTANPDALCSRQVRDELNVFAVVTKPFQPRVLIETIEAAVSETESAL
jgi:CheY-like chemotaxis protein